MSDNNIDTKNKFSSRSILAWLVFAVVAIYFIIIKPDVKINERLFYLPTVSNLPAVNKTDVQIVGKNSFDSYFLYDKVGYITITMPISKSRLESVSKNNATHIVKSTAALAGADKVMIISSRAMPWFDTGQEVFRMHAVIMR